MTHNAKPKLPPRVKVIEILRRYLRPEALIDAKSDYAIFYGLFSQYPSLDFWTRHELSFPLNSVKWFLTVPGKAQLASDWTTFHFVLDTGSQEGYDGGVKAESTPDITPDYVAPVKRAATVADLLKS